MAPRILLGKICLFPVTSTWPLGIGVPFARNPLPEVRRAREGAEAIGPLENGIMELLKEDGCQDYRPSHFVDHMGQG